MYIIIIINIIIIITQVRIGYGVGAAVSNTSMITTSSVAPGDSQATVLSTEVASAQPWMDCCDFRTFWLRWDDTDTDTDTWFIVKATDPYTRRELGGGAEGGGGGERILHFSTIFDDLMDDVHCSAHFYHFTLYIAMSVRYNRILTSSQVGRQDCGSGHGAGRGLRHIVYP